MLFGTKIYEYEKCSIKFYYLTIGGVQVGGPMFSQREVDEAIDKIWRGSKYVNLRADAAE